MQRVHFQVGVGVFNCQQILTKISFVIFNIVVKNKSNVVKCGLYSYRQYTLFQNGGCLRWSRSSCMKTSHRGPNNGVYKCFYRSRYAVMPQNCCVPECKKKVYVENGVKISFHTFPEERKLFMKWIVAIRRDIGKHFHVTKHTRVCSRHFKPSDYLPSLTGRKRTLKPTAVPSVCHWKKRSPVIWKAPTRRSPIKRKKTTEKAITKADLPKCDSTCDVFLEPQDTPFLSSITENLENTTVDQPADDSQSIIRDI